MFEEQNVRIENGDTFHEVLSKFGALALDKQENLSELIGNDTGFLDLEKGFINFGNIEMPIQILGYYVDSKKQWFWAWDNDIGFDDSVIKAAIQMKEIGDEFFIPEFNLATMRANFDDCHTLAMSTISLLDYDAYYAVNEEGIDIFVAIKSDLIKENNSVEKFRDTFYTFQKNFDINAKLAFKSYTELKNYIYKAHDEFDLTKIGESRIIVGYTERGNVTHIQMLLED